MTSAREILTRTADLPLDQFLRALSHEVSSLPASSSIQSQIAAAKTVLEAVSLLERSAVTTERLGLILTRVEQRVIGCPRCGAPVVFSPPETACSCGERITDGAIHRPTQGFGEVLEPVAGLLITVPVLLPAAMEFGIDPLQLGIVMILNLVLGLLTPPVGLVLYVLSSVTGASVQQVIRGTVPFLIPLLITLLLITFFPPFSLWLPTLLAG